jgi:F-type H+-transporting ATPase subunit c
LHGYVNHPLAEFDKEKQMRKLLFLFFLMALVLVAAPVYAQGNAPAAETPINWAVPIAAGIGMAVASGLCGLGQGKATAAASEAIARNPGATAGIRFALILGLVLIESLALYTLAIIIIKVK